MKHRSRRGEKARKKEEERRLLLACVDFSGFTLGKPHAFTTTDQPFKALFVMALVDLVLVLLSLLLMLLEVVMLLLLLLQLYVDTQAGDLGQCAG